MFSVEMAGHAWRSLPRDGGQGLFCALIVTNNIRHVIYVRVSYFLIYIYIYTYMSDMFLFMRNIFLLTYLLTCNLHT